MWNQPIRIQLGKILREILFVVGKSCGKLLWENLAGNCCRKLLQENLAGNCCGKILLEIVVGNCCRKILWENLAGNAVGQGGGGKANLRKAVIGENLAFGIG